MANKRHYSDLVRTAFYIEGKLVYKKLKNRYRIFCMKCLRYEYVTKEEFKQIQASQICPMCYQEVKLTSIQKHWILRYILDDDDDGYRMFIKYKFGCIPKIKYEHVFRYQNGVAEARLIVCNMGWSFGYRPDLEEWKVRDANKYFYRFCTINTGQPIESKREYIYTALFDRGITNEQADEIVKSNQRKIFQDYLLNGAQMEYVIQFDLKSYKEVYKYRTYMRQNNPDERKRLNVYYLDYLYRNKIRLRDFYDYMRDCEFLGFKLDKPKDFQHRHLVVAELAIEKKNKKNEELAKLRYSELIQYAYKKGKIQILPFKDGKEIRRCGKQLHNCIGTYVGRYGNKTTDLYYLSKSGKKTIAIEVSNNRLIQARSDKNGKCPADLMKHIRKWCSINNIEYRI